MQQKLMENSLEVPEWYKESARDINLNSIATLESSCTNPTQISTAGTTEIAVKPLVFTSSDPFFPNPTAGRQEEAKDSNVSNDFDSAQDSVVLQIDFQLSQDFSQVVGSLTTAPSPPGSSTSSEDENDDVILPKKQESILNAKSEGKPPNSEENSNSNKPVSSGDGNNSQKQETAPSGGGNNSHKKQEETVVQEDVIVDDEPELIEEQHGELLEQQDEEFVEQEKDVASTNTTLKQTPSQQHDISATKDEKKDDNSCPEVSDKDCMYKRNVVSEHTEVFALFSDRCLYPAKVEQILQNSYLIRFDDCGRRVTIAKDDVISEAMFHKGQKCLLKHSDGYYYRAQILASDWLEGAPVYCVESQGCSRIVRRNALCFKEEHQQIILDATLDDESDLAPVAEKSKTCTPTRRGIPLKSSRKRKTSTPLQSTKLNKTKTSSLFKDISFLVTKESKAGSDDGDVHVIMELIRSHGGTILDTIRGRAIDKAKHAVCISDQPSCTSKFIYCVVVGIPVLHHDWVEESITTGHLQPYQNYLLPAGRNIFHEEVQQRCGKREPYHPLNPLRIFVHEDRHSPSHKDLNKILSKAGCERVATGVFIENPVQEKTSKRCAVGTDKTDTSVQVSSKTSLKETSNKSFVNAENTSKKISCDKPKKFPFSLFNVDFVLTMCPSVPDLLYHAARDQNIPIVTCAWLIETLITNRLVDPDVSPLYRYTKQDTTS